MSKYSKLEKQQDSLSSNVERYTRLVMDYRQDLNRVETKYNRLMKHLGLTEVEHPAKVTLEESKLPLDQSIKLNSFKVLKTSAITAGLPRATIKTTVNVPTTSTLISGKRLKRFVTIYNNSADEKEAARLMHISVDSIRRYASEARRVGHKIEFNKAKQIWTPARRKAQSERMKKIRAARKDAWGKK